MEELQMIAFEIIAVVGEVRKLFADGVKLAAEGAIAEARQKIAEGNKAMIQAQQAHMGCIQKEADGVALPFSILFMHAEDQLFSAEVIRDMSVQLITVYEKLYEKRGTNP